MNADVNPDDHRLRAVPSDPASVRKQFARDISQLAIHEWRIAPSVTAHRHKATFAFGFGSMVSQRKYSDNRFGIAVGVTRPSDDIEYVTSVAVPLDSPGHDLVRRVVGEKAWEIAQRLDVGDRETIDLGHDDAEHLKQGWAALIAEIVGSADGGQDPSPTRPDAGDSSDASPAGTHGSAKAPPRPPARPEQQEILSSRSATTRPAGYGRPAAHRSYGGA